MSMNIEDDWRALSREMDRLEDEPVITDFSHAYANNNDYYIYFYYVPSGTKADTNEEPYIRFKAFLTSFEDMFISSWRDEDIYGRMDLVSTFQNTKRQINFTFDVVAGERVEAKSNYNKSRTLLSYLYPVYEEIAPDRSFVSNSIAAPPLVKIKFANLICERMSDNQRLPLVGKLNGLAYKPNLDMGFFEHRRVLYPKVNSFTCDFTVLHTQPPFNAVDPQAQHPAAGICSPSTETDPLAGTRRDEFGADERRQAINRQRTDDNREANEEALLTGNELECF